MSVSIITKELNARTVTIKLVDGSIIHGKVNLHRNNVDINRVSDLFTRVDEPFVVVFDITAESETGEVLILNKSKILWVEPGDKPRKEQKLVQFEDEKPKEASKGSLLDRLRLT
jgi:hypothetical protein